MSSAVRIRLALAALLACGAASAAEHAPPKDGAGLLVSGAAGLPDLARGQQAAAAGRTADAERDLVPLAERGYLEAQYALAKLYGHMETPEATARAITWYRRVLPKKPEVQLPLARLLLRDPQPAARNEAEDLLRKAWTQRSEVDALAALIRLYSEFPEQDRGNRLAGYAARAEKLDRAETNLALLHWYRATPALDGHPARLVALCRKSLDLAPECYVDLVSAARAAGNAAEVQSLGAALLSQLGAGRVTATVGATFARALLADAEGTLGEDPPPVVSDLAEDDNPAAFTSPPASAAQSCAQAPVTAGAPAPVTAPVPAAATAPVPATAAAPAATAAATAKAAPPASAANAEPQLAEAILRRLLAGTPEARVLAAGVIVRFPYLAPDVEPEALLQAGLKQGVAPAALYLGELYLGGHRARRDPVAAREALAQAASIPATAIPAEFYLGRLYQAGYLDEVDPAQARDHLLKAARAGYLAADSALARLYASGKGICPNHRYAWVFARLGAAGGSEPIRQLLAALQQAMPPEELRAGEALLREERAARDPARNAAASAAAPAPANQADAAGSDS